MQSIPLRFSRKVDASKTDDENLYLLKLRTALEEYQHSTPLLHLRESLRILCDRSTTTTMNETPVRLLSIDGGGVRGLSALVLLEQLMEHVNDQRASQGLPKQEPWELFDLMGGTSTGGYGVSFRLAEVTVADSR
jgi:hypothetical protein